MQVVHQSLKKKTNYSPEICTIQLQSERLERIQNDKGEDKTV